MEFVKDTTWNEIFEGWRAREANNQSWVKYATETKGWPDWASWRNFMAEQVSAEKREWKIFRFTDPDKEIPGLLIGPHSGWQGDLPLKNSLSFKELLEIPEKFKGYTQHTGIQAIIDGLPFPAQLIGLLREDCGRIVCFEGNHTALAIALANKQAKHIDWSGVDINIAVAVVPSEEHALFDTVLARGTAKNPT